MYRLFKFSSSVSRAVTLHQPSSIVRVAHHAASAQRLLQLRDQHPRSNVRFVDILNQTVKVNPLIHPQIQHAAMPWADLRRMAVTFGSEIVEKFIHYVVPHRELLYRTIAFVCANVRTESMEHLHETVQKCFSLYQIKHLQDIQVKHEQIAQLSQAQAIKCLVDYEENSHGSDIVLQRLIDAYMVRQGSTTTASATRLSENIDLITAYAAYLTKQSLVTEINYSIQTANEQLFAEGVIQPLATVSSADSVTVIVGGAPATGKGELTKQLIQYGLLQLTEMCRLCPDEWHYSLKTVGIPTDLGVDKCYHGALLREETLVIRNIIVQELDNRKRNGQNVPNCFWELIVLTEQRLLDIAIGDGKVVCYFTQHNDPLKVVLGSLERFTNTGRLVVPQVILQSLQDLAREQVALLIAILKRNFSKPVQVVGYDMTALHADKKACSLIKPIYTADSDSGKLIIYDLEKKLRFFAHKYIDPNAKDAEGLYIKTIETHLQEIVAEFKNEYKGIIGNVVMVDPTVDLTKQQLSDKHVYAHFNDEGQLIIDNEEIYANVIECSEISRAFFNAFKPYQSDVTNTI